MKLFTIDRDHNMAVYAAAEQVPAEDHIHSFGHQRELAKLVEFLSGEELVQIWNSFAGVAPFGELKPVKKFTDRQTAIMRIWKSVQRLEPPVAPPSAHRGRKGKRSSMEPATKATMPAVRAGSKKAHILELLRRPEGATLSELVKATGWQGHSVRGFLSGSLTKKMGLHVESFKKEDGARAYRIFDR